MPISTGTRLGSYEVLAPIGSGGMGEVYQAHDSKLGRDVAIKVLPEAFAHDPDRLSRFQREAKILYEWERDILTRLTFAGESNSFPAWTPDGQRIVYSSQEKNGAINLWWIRSDGAGEAQRLAESKSAQYARSWQPDGKVLAFGQQNPNYDIMTLSIEGDEKSGWKPGEPKPFLSSPFIEQSPAFSPDGRWLAYHSIR